MNLLAAAAAKSSAVRKIVLKTSTLVYGSNFADPYFFRETDASHASATTPVERSLLEVDALVGDFAEDHPRGSAVTSLRFANVLGDDVSTGVLAHVAHARGSPRCSATSHVCSSCTRTT